MKEFGQTYGWIFTGLSLLVGLTALSVAIAAFLRGRKTFTYQLLINSPIVRVTAKTPADIQVMYKGVPAANIRIIQFELWNSGGATIDEADFLTAPGILLPEESEIGTCQVK